MPRTSLSAMAAGVAGALFGRHLIGSALINSLQVEPSGSRSFDVYRFMRDVSPWAGAVLGAGAGLVLVALAAATTSVLSRRRHAI